METPQENAVPETPEMWSGGPILPHGSPFSREVFKIVRPSVPRHAWPESDVTGLFMPRLDGTGLIAEFEDLTGPHRATAERLVAENGAKLVMLSPAAPIALVVINLRRWRGICLYALLPLFFCAIIGQAFTPVVGRLLGTLSLVDIAAFVALHLRLMQLKQRLEGARFLARIPTPGLHIKVEGYEAH